MELNFFWCFLPANRAVEVNEMWRAREKELELDKRVTGSSKDKRSDDKRHMDHNTSRSAERHAGDDRSTSASASCSTKNEYGHTQEGLKDEELEEFLHSRYYYSLILSDILSACMNAFKISTVE